MLAQRRDRGLVQRDHPPPGITLRRPGHQPTAELLQLPRHGQCPSVQIQVAPPQARSLAAAQAPERNQGLPAESSRP
jgi:hypothetical protein